MTAYGLAALVAEKLGPMAHVSVNGDQIIVRFDKDDHRFIIDVRPEPYDPDDFDDCQG